MAWRLSGFNLILIDLNISVFRVLAQVSCEVTEPKQARPNEGVLFVNVELSPMAASHFEPGR